MVRLQEHGGDVVRLLVQTMRLAQQQQQQQQQQPATPVPSSPAAAAQGDAGAAAAAAAAAAAGGCEVLCEEQSRWLLVSETFNPDVPRWVSGVKVFKFMGVQSSAFCLHTMPAAYIFLLGQLTNSHAYQWHRTAQQPDHPGQCNLRTDSVPPVVSAHTHCTQLFGFKHGMCVG
jgi:hypothetical protein